MQILPLSSWILVVAALLMLACAQSEPVSRMPTRESTIANQTAASLVSPVGEVWKPVLSTSWQWQLTDPPIGHSIDAEMFDIDLFETNAATVAALHADGRKVISAPGRGTSSFKAKAVGFTIRRLKILFDETTVGRATKAALESAVKRLLADYGRETRGC